MHVLLLDNQQLTLDKEFSFLEWFEDLFLNNVFFQMTMITLLISIFNFSVTETHQMAEATEEKNAKMKEALGIKKDYKDGSSFDQELKAAQRAAVQLAWEAKQKDLEKQKEKEEIKR